MRFLSEQNEKAIEAFRIKDPVSSLEAMWQCFRDETKPEGLRAIASLIYIKSLESIDLSRMLP